MDVPLGCYVQLITFHGKNMTLTNKSLYGKLPYIISAKIQVSRMRLAGHCARHTEEIQNKLVLWEPTNGIANRGGRQISYIENLMNDTGVDNIKELMAIMSHRDD